MNRWTVGLLTLGLLLATAASAAAREPGIKTQGQRENGTRPDITVPYLTTGNSTLMPGYVAPRIYYSPIVDDPQLPQLKAVYNLPFYGAVQAFGDRSNGATPRPK